LATPSKLNLRKNNVKDYSAAVEAFFSAYNTHDVDGMIALCAEGAQGRYLPYGRESVMPIRGGLEAIWRGFAQAVPDFGVDVVEMIPAEPNIVVVQGVLGGTMPTDVPGFAKKGQIARYAHCFILRFAEDSKISRIDCYWDNFGTSFVKASAL
jgi:ketosteroid isomerase-like protein